MAYDRYDTRRGARDEGRWSSGRDEQRDWGGERGRRDERGFFERAGDQISSWFGDEDRDRSDRAHSEHRERAGDFDRSYGERGYRERGDYRPMTGDYGRGHHESGQFFAASGVGRGDYERSQGPWRNSGQRATNRSGTDRRGDDFDPHYHDWRQRQMAELDRDYDEYRRENQSRFEREFSSWREQRQQKRSLLGRIREHMEVVGSDDAHVGTIDRVAGDRIILAKSDPESGGAHHSLSCADIEAVEGDRVILGCSSDQAKERWRDENRSRALFEREDQGEMGPRILDRSFEGTYR